MTTSSTQLRRQRKHGNPPSYHRPRIVLAMALGITVLSQTPRAAAEPRRSTLDAIRTLNPHLVDSDEPNFTMKVWALSRSEYGFFRGTADLFYQWCLDHCDDLLTPGTPHICLHGDIHIGNIGTYQSHGKLGNDIHFGVVDLDETFEGPAQLDLLRAVVALRFLAKDQKLVLSEKEWVVVTSRLCSAYESALRGRGTGGNSGEADDVIASLLKKARSAKPRKYLKKYCDLTTRRFRPVRMKKGRISDIMQPVDMEERRRVTSALWQYLKSTDSVVKTILAGIQSEEDMRAAVLDVARWTRLDSSGSQSLRKYLVLLAANETAPEGLLLLQLKEEPIPAISRAGGTQSEQGKQPIGVVTHKDNDRAAFVSGAYRRLLAPAKWAIGHTRIGKTGFLVKPKDPWGKEPSTKMFKDKAGVGAAAELLGATLGTAHRNAIKPVRDRDAVVDRLLRHLNRLSLSRQSEAAAAWLMRAYEDLRKDPRTHAMIKQAEVYIQGAGQPTQASSRSTKDTRGVPTRLSPDDT